MIKLKKLIMASTEENTWRDSIFTQLQQRNRTQTEYFQDLIASRMYYQL